MPRFGVATVVGLPKQKDVKDSVIAHKTATTRKLGAQLKNTTRARNAAGAVSCDTFSAARDGDDDSDVAVASGFESGAFTCSLLHQLK